MLKSNRLDPQVSCQVYIGRPRIHSIKWITFREFKELSFISWTSADDMSGRLRVTQSTERDSPTHFSWLQQFYQATGIQQDDFTVTTFPRPDKTNWSRLASISSMFKVVCHLKLRGFCRSERLPLATWEESPSEVRNAMPSRSSTITN